MTVVTGISESYIGYIRSGRRDNPTMRAGVSYLVDGDIGLQLQQERLSNTIDDAMQRRGIQQLVVLLARMSANSVTAMTSVAYRLTRIEWAKIGPDFAAGRLPDRRGRNS